MAWRRVGETWWLKEAVKELDEWVPKRIRKLSIMAGGGGSAWPCGGGAAARGGLKPESGRLQRAQLWWEGDNEGFLPFVDVDELAGAGADLGVVGEGTARLSGD